MGFMARSPVWVPLNCLLAVLSAAPRPRCSQRIHHLWRVDISIWRSQRKATPLVEETQQTVVAAMETLPPGFTAPLKVEIRTARTWAECK